MSTGYKITKKGLVAPGHISVNAKGKAIRVPDFYPAEGRSHGNRRKRKSVRPA